VSLTTRKPAIAPVLYIEGLVKCVEGLVPCVEGLVLCVEVVAGYR